MSNVLITGAAGGFGKLTVAALVKAGHKVAGTVRDANGRNKAAAATLKQQGVTVVEMDVTQDGSVDQGVSAALSRLGGIDVVVNNAGVGVLGFQECFTTDDWRKVFEVNVFGVQRVGRAVLPHFKERGQGLFINISSLLGRMVVPFYGPYNASKWALEALSENYRVELGQLGIETCIVEPGGYPTSFMGNLLRPSEPARASSYGAMKDMPDAFFIGFEQALAGNPVQNPANVADAVVGLVGQPRGQRPFRTMVDKMGMGAALGNYNAQLEGAMKGVFGAFHIDHLLTVKTDSKQAR